MGYHQIENFNKVEILKNDPKLNYESEKYNKWNKNNLRESWNSRFEHTENRISTFEYSLILIIQSD